MSEFKVLHLSDLHFYNHKGTTSSLGYRMKIKEHCERNKYDLYVISGDLTDDGRKDSFLDAYDWLFGDGENSLALPKHKTIVVPGNHDAFNKNDNDYVVNVGRGEIDGRIQKCLDNYHEIFNEYKYEHTNINKGVNCKWFPVVENDGIFVISLSSCYLGDPFKNLMPVGVGTALGQLDSEQIEYIFSICDKGLKGELKDSDGELVKGDAFSRSVKILVMHHFLFNIYSGKEKGILEKINNQYFMKIKKREMVLQNLMMADIDFVVCGHSHIGDVGEHTFECHFKNKYARERILMNYFRKKCGFCSKPIIEKFKNGQFLGKPYRVICEMSVRIGKRGEDLADLFAYGLDPTQNRSLRNGIRDILTQAHGSYVTGY
ncbi:MAG: metallophosphoesterase, partial [Anaerohalosphaeraceae bacterium]